MIVKNIHSACLDGNIEKIENELSKIPCPCECCHIKFLSLALYIACKCKNEDIVNFVISKDINGTLDYNKGLSGACLGGDEKLVLMMISKGANSWNIGLQAACRGGHRTIVDLMISKGANDFNTALLNVYLSDTIEHLAIAKYLVDNGADNQLLRHKLERVSASVCESTLEIIFDCY